MSQQKWPRCLSEKKTGTCTHRVHLPI